MKLTYALPIAALVLAPLAHAQSDHMKDMNMGAHPMAESARAAPAATHHAAGVVKSVDAGKGTVTVAHGAIASLNWPAMTMTFKAKDDKMLDTLKPGQKIDFEFVQQGKAYVVTRVK
jgi:Cu/Ag efflux protein CusF